MDLKKLKSKEKLEYILKLQSEGLEPKDIADKMGYSQLKNLNDFMRRQGYSKTDNSYILKMEDTCPINEIAITMEDTCPIDDMQEDIYPTIDIQKQQKLIDIIDNHNKIMDIIKWFDSKEDICLTEVIEVVNGLQINYNKSKPVKTTVRVDDVVWEEFSNMCKDKYSQYSKVDLLSQALHEFCDKYK